MSLFSNNLRNLRSNSDFMCDERLMSEEALTSRDCRHSEGLRSALLLLGYCESFFSFAPTVLSLYRSVNVVAAKTETKQSLRHMLGVFVFQV